MSGQATVLLLLLLLLVTPFIQRLSEATVLLEARVALIEEAVASLDGTFLEVVW
ncbi:MAG: hypothetical protein ACOC45_06305 [Alkalispirochaetaceae bacterium]